MRQHGGVQFTKGHGTGNDFVILPDPGGRLPLTPALVAALCDRRRGIGADGVLRVVRAADHPDAVGLAAEAEWFMDYWNADGSYAEMCGNGVRVFARYLVDSGLVEAGPAAAGLPIATRAGVVRALVGPETIAVDMVRPRIRGESRASVGRLSLPGTAVDCGNPHLVCLLPSDTALDALDLTVSPGFDSGLFPAGANVEFVEFGEVGPFGGLGGPGPSAAAGTPDGSTGDAVTRVRMRVYERGSAETLSCGSGACAVAEVALRAAGRTDGTVGVDVPGGSLTVRLAGDECWLSGPAVLVAHGELSLAALGVPDGISVPDGIDASPAVLGVPDGVGAFGAFGG